MDPSTEREFKYLVDPDHGLTESAVDELVGAAIGRNHPGDEARLLPPAIRILTAGYWDTAELSLLRNGHTLRYRSASDRSETGWTLKLHGATSNGLTTRQEIHFKGSSKSPPLGALSLVRAVVRSAPLEPIVTLKTTRREIVVVDDLGQPTLRVDDDNVEILDRGHPIGSFHEIEIEVLSDDGLDDAERVAKRLRRAGADGSNPKPKLERALHGRLERPTEPRTLGKKCSSTDLVAWAITRSLTALIRHDPFTRLGHDPEELHLARVAIRRLRSDLRTVAPILDGDWVASVRSELGWIADALGAVRDLDVLRERFVGQIGVADSGDLAGFEALLAELHSQWSEARRKLLVALDSSRYVDLLDRLELASRTPDFIVDGEKSSSARDVLIRVCRATWKRVVKAVDDCGPASWEDVPEVRLHAIRRRVKHARYGAELATAVVGKRASRHARALSRLQDDLGELQDSAVASAWLHDQGRTTSDPAVAFVAGLLFELQQSEASMARSHCYRSWLKASSTASTSWLE